MFPMFQMCYKHICLITASGDKLKAFITHLIVVVSQNSLGFFFGLVKSGPAHHHLMSAFFHSVHRLHIFTVRICGIYFLEPTLIFRIQLNRSD